MTAVLTCLLCVNDTLSFVFCESRDSFSGVEFSVLLLMTEYKLDMLLMPTLKLSKDTNYERMVSKYHFPIYYMLSRHDRVKTNFENPHSIRFSHTKSNFHGTQKRKLLE